MTTHLSFELPPFLRMKWTSEPARRLWRDRLTALEAALHRVRFQQIQRFQASHAARWRITAVSKAWWSELETLGCPHRLLEDRQPALFHLPRKCNADVKYVAYGPPDLLRELDTAQLGRPPCCVGAIDTSTLHDTTFPLVDGERTELEALAMHRNPFWSPMGITLSTHLQCGPDCQGQHEALETLAELEAEFPDEHRWLEEIFSWPLSWSSLHGIAEVKTPILTFCHNARPTAGEISIHVSGTAYPEQGAWGRGFPYKARRRPSRVAP